jgi:hypothetical protein
MCQVDSSTSSISKTQTIPTFARKNSKNNFFVFLSCCLIHIQFFAIARQFWEELEDKFVQVELELLVVSSCVFLELDEKTVQLDLLVVSSYVIPRQICPIGIVSCVILCNTKTNLSNWNWNC